MVASAAVKAIEQTLDQIDPESPRGQVLESAKRFKTNWAELGQRLAQVLDKSMHLDWGYSSFDHYVRAELNIRKETAFKLVRSFSLVKEKRPEIVQSQEWEKLPQVEVIDFLTKRRKEEAMNEEQFTELTSQAIDESWTPRTVSQKWRELVSDDHRADKVVEDPSIKAVRRAKELADKLHRLLTEIPGVDASLVDAAQTISMGLEELAA